MAYDYERPGTLRTPRQLAPLHFWMDGENGMLGTLSGPGAPLDSVLFGLDPDQPLFGSIHRVLEKSVAIFSDTMFISWGTRKDNAEMAVLATTTAEGATDKAVAAHLGRSAVDSECGAVERLENWTIIVRNRAISQLAMLAAHETMRDSMLYASPLTINDIPWLYKKVLLDQLPSALRLPQQAA